MFEVQTVSAKQFGADPSFGGQSVQNVQAPSFVSPASAKGRISLGLTRGRKGVGELNSLNGEIPSRQDFKCAKNPFVSALHG